jgi:hypothetical protein
VARPSTPNLADVLANVCPGRVAYICLTREQKRALRDPEGQIALDVLRHLLGARPMSPERFPLTQEAFQAVACRLGYLVGQKGCRRMVKRLLNSGVIGACGQYRQPYRNSAARSGSAAPSTSSVIGCALPALLSESVLSASTRLSRGILGPLVGARPLWRPSGPTSARDTSRRAAADEVTR